MDTLLINSTEKDLTVCIGSTGTVRMQQNCCTDWPYKLSMYVRQIEMGMKLLR